MLKLWKMSLVTSTRPTCHLAIFWVNYFGITGFCNQHMTNYMRTFIYTYYIFNCSKNWATLYIEPRILMRSNFALSVLRCKMQSTINWCQLDITSQLFCYLKAASDDTQGRLRPIRYLTCIQVIYLFNVLCATHMTCKRIHRKVRICSTCQQQLGDTPAVTS